MASWRLLLESLYYLTYLNYHYRKTKQKSQAPVITVWILLMSNGITKNTLVGPKVMHKSPYLTCIKVNLRAWDYLNISSTVQNLFVYLLRVYSFNFIHAVHIVFLFYWVCSISDHDHKGKTILVRCIQLCTIWIDHFYLSPFLISIFWHQLFTLAQIKIITYNLIVASIVQIRT